LAIEKNKVPNTSKVILRKLFPLSPSNTPPFPSHPAVPWTGNIPYKQDRNHRRARLKGVSGKIAFQSDRDGDWEIYIMNADGSNLVQLTHNTFADEYPVWSPDGQQIAFQTNRDGNYEIYVMNADGTAPRNLTQHPSEDRNPGWSPDGKRIAFDSRRNNDLEIYLLNLDGSGLVQFTDKLGRNILPDWSPDGKFIAYTGNRYLGWNVYIMSLDHTLDWRLTDGHAACRPDWSPDGKRIAYVSSKADGKGDIWLRNPDGSGETRLTFDDKNYDYHPAWSPDGNYLAYAKTSDKKNGNWELYLMTADGKEHLRLTDHPARDSFPDCASGSVAAIATSLRGTQTEIP
jgi:TolB protein